jgi:hypothetical protein
VLVLDENLPEGQRLWLRKWRIHFRAIGIEVAASGTKDRNLIPVLHRLANPTFFSLDRNLYRPDWVKVGNQEPWNLLAACRLTVKPLGRNRAARRP